MDAEALGFALLFSIPTGVGVTMAVAVTEGGPTSPLALTAGAVVGLGVFVLILAGAADGSDAAD